MKNISLLIICIFIAISIKAQTNATTVETRVTDKSLLWEISGNGLENPSYIFGTIHLIPEDDYFFTDLMKAKLSDCKTLVLEVDINMSLKEQIALAKKIILPKGKTLEDYMSVEQYKKYSDYILDSLKIKKSKYKQMNKIKPIFGSSIVLSELLGKIKSYEQELNKIAKKNNMNIVGLETADYQIDILDKISIKKQVEMIAGEDMYSKQPLTEYYKIIKVYKKQDLEMLNKLFKAEKSMQEFENELLYDRNRNWIQIIEKLSKENPIFVAVGAAHLPGKKGVLNLLKEKGFSVRVVKGDF